MRCSHRAATAIVLVFGSAVACDTQSPSGPSSAGAVPTGPFQMSGRVVDFATNVGVPGVTVALASFGSSPQREWTAVTDNAGTYALVLPEVGPYVPQVDGAGAGLMRVTGSGYRGDLFVHPGTCIARYGMIADGRTFRPVAGAAVSLGTRKVLSGPDGSYRMELGCSVPSNPLLIGVNTTYMYVSHPDYADASPVVGRGVQRVERLDVWLDRPSVGR